VLFDVGPAPRTRAGAIPGVAPFAPTWSTCSAGPPTNSRNGGRRWPSTTNGFAIKGGIDWGDLVGVTLVTLLFGLLAVIAFGRRDIYT